jgi:hypothetical protein
MQPKNGTIATTEAAAYKNVATEVGDLWRR